MKHQTFFSATRLLSIMLLLLQPGAAFASKPANIIILLADDVSARELSTYGGSIEMPNLDKLAENGIQFTTAWATPLCGPTRAMIMTGKYPHNQGYWENSVTPSKHYFDDSRHLPLLQMARKAGYRTGFFGKLHHGEPKDMEKVGADTYLTYRYWEGYDGPDQGRGGPQRQGMYGISWYWHPGVVKNGKGVPTRNSDFGPDMELAALIEFVEDNRNQPFLAYWSTNLPHQAYSPEQDKWYYTDVPPINTQGTPGEKKVKGSLKATMHYLDYLLGQLSQSLETMGLANRTILFFASDNGTANGTDKGQYEKDNALRVPFVVAGGPVVSKGQVPALIDYTDIWPTIADLTGFKGEHNCDGRSFAPLLLGEPFQPRDHCLMAMNNARWIRTREWLLDGRGHFYSVHNAKEREDYIDLTHSHDPEVQAARRQLQQHLNNNLPLPDYNDPLTAKSWAWFHANHKPIEVFSPKDSQ